MPRLRSVEPEPAKRVRGSVTKGFLGLAAAEPLAHRVTAPSAVSGTLDEFRLLPTADKRARDVAKKLDRLAARQGWYIFLAGQAHAEATGTGASEP